MAPVLSLQDLTKRFGDTTAVAGLTLDVEAGGVVGLLGPNGAGKTTLFRLILGLVRPSHGHAEVLGQSIRSPAAYLDDVGALIEGPSFLPSLSGRANLRRLAAAGGRGHDRVEALLGRVDLADRADERVQAYSMGMKQRLGIAAALLPDPKLVLLDEPMNGLDPAGIREMRGLLRGLTDEGRTVIVSSHNLAEVQKTSDRVIVLQKGRLVHYGSVEGLEQGARFVVVAEKPGSHPDLVELCRGGGLAATLVPAGVQIEGGPKEAAAVNRHAMKAGITLVEIRPVSVDLEESFFELTEAQA